MPPEFFLDYIGEGLSEASARQIPARVRLVVGEATTVGRSAHVTGSFILLCVTPEASVISRVHAVLEAQLAMDGFPPHVVVRCGALPPRNGTYVAGVRIEQGQRVPLLHGEEVVFGGGKDPGTPPLRRFAYKLTIVSNCNSSARSSSGDGAISTDDETESQLLTRFALEGMSTQQAAAMTCDALQNREQKRRKDATVQPIALAALASSKRVRLQATTVATCDKRKRPDEALSPPLLLPMPPPSPPPLAPLLPASCVLCGSAAVRLLPKCGCLTCGACLYARAEAALTSRQQIHAGLACGGCGAELLPRRLLEQVAAVAALTGTDSTAAVATSARVLADASSITLPLCLRNRLGLAIEAPAPLPTPAAEASAVLAAHLLVCASALLSESLAATKLSRSN